MRQISKSKIYANGLFVAICSGNFNQFGFLKKLKINNAYLSASSRTSTLKSSPRQDETMIYLDVEKYQSKKRYYTENHCLKDVHVVLDVSLTISESINKKLLYS